MGSEQKSRAKVSTRELFGDILGEVELAWENQGRRSAASSGERSQPSRSANGSARLNPANHPSKSETAKLPDPPLSESPASTTKDARKATPEPSRAQADSAAAESAGREPSAHPFAASETPQWLPANGQSAASTRETTPLESDSDPQPDSAPAAGQPGGAPAIPGDEESSARSEQVRLADSATPEPALAPTPRSTPDVASLLEPDDADAEALADDSEKTADETPAEDLVGTGYLPWLEEKRSTNWTRLAAMAAVVAVAGLAIWWFALRPADASAEVTGSSSAPVEAEAQAGESFIAELEQDAQAEGEVVQAVTARDEVAAVVEAPEAIQPPVAQTTQSSAAQPVTPAPQQAGPTAAELEAMIAGQLAAQERRLRQQLEEQRRQLEEEIARLEAANAVQSQPVATGGEPAVGESAAEAEAATADDATGDVAAAGTVD